jgi:hypothetical protein
MACVTSFVTLSLDGWRIIIVDDKCHLHDEK